MTAWPLQVGLELAGAELLQLLTGDHAEALHRLDRSGIAFAVIGAERAEAGVQQSLSPTVAATWLAQRTESIGLVVAASVQRDHPYNLARRLASVDHSCRGRAGWLVAADDHAIALGLQGRSSWIQTPLDNHARADAVAAVRKLWRTWPLETLHADPAVSGPVSIRRTDHEGVFSIGGPLNCPGTPQGEPVVLWPWWGQGAAKDEYCAARHADIVVVDEEQLDTVLAVAVAVAVAVGAEHTRPQIYVRVRAERVTPMSVQRWKAAPMVHGLVLACGPGRRQGTLESLLEWLVPAVHAPSRSQGHAGGVHLRTRLGIVRRTAPQLESHALAFEDIAKGKA